MSIVDTVRPLSLNFRVRRAARRTAEAMAEKARLRASIRARALTAYGVSDSQLAASCKRLGLSLATADRVRKAIEGGKLIKVTRRV